MSTWSSQGELTTTAYMDNYQREFQNYQLNSNSKILIDLKFHRQFFKNKPEVLCCKNHYMKCHILKLLPEISRVGVFFLFIFFK